MFAVVLLYTTLLYSRGDLLIITFTLCRCACQAEDDPVGPPPIDDPVSGTTEAAAEFTTAWR